MFFFFQIKDTRFFQSRDTGRKKIPESWRRNLVNRSKKNNRKVDLGGRIKKTVSSTVFDGFPWNVGQMPRQGLEVSFFLRKFL